MTEDENHLNLLAIFHYVVGGLTALFASVPLIHVGLGIAMILGAFEGKDAPPPFFGWLFVLMGGLFVLFGWTLAVAMLIAGGKLRRRQSRTYCLVVAALECLVMPFGTVLGIFTIIVLMKEAVNQLFTETAPTP